MNRTRRRSGVELMTDLFTQPAPASFAPGDKDQFIRKLVFAVRDLIPWAACGASKHQNSSHADRTIQKARDAVAALGYSLGESEKVEWLEQTELDELRAKYEALIEQTNETRQQHNELVRIGRLMCQCRSGVGEDDHELYQQLEAVIGAKAAAFEKIKGE